ncbi:MAG TPA: hypothetical protein VN708_12125 [Terriglobales bacterium]|nr:hypothetical protein [Terriglobales bacterium]
MDRPVTTPGKSDHLICRTGWAVLVTIACAYFTYRSFVAIREREFAWQHNWWDTLTWLVWTALAAGAISEVRCWRERILFALLFLQFLLGSIFSIWTSASFNLSLEGRWFSLLLWMLATTLSILALFGGGRKSTTGPQVRS